MKIELTFHYLIFVVVDLRFTIEQIAKGIYVAKLIESYIVACDTQIKFFHRFSLFSKGTHTHTNNMNIFITNNVFAINCYFHFGVAANVRMQPNVI